MLKNLNGDYKIVLYDDVQTTYSWDYLEHFINIPVEPIEVEHITDYKSLVDTRSVSGRIPYTENSTETMFHHLYCCQVIAITGD